MSDSSDPRRESGPQSRQDLAPADPTETGAPPPNGYDPADYRWVPVRRRPRADGWTEEKQRRFIEMLADTGLVGEAARAVGMTRETAYRLRRAPHGAAFARAWDAARHHAGGLVEDIAFERALEGVEHNVYDECGNVVCTKRVYNDRLLMFLLRHLRPERYDRQSPERTVVAPSPDLPASLQAMEPAMPAPPEQLLAPAELAAELELAEIADGTLPHFLNEQRPVPTAAQDKQAERARGQAAYDKMGARDTLSRGEFDDFCRYLDPVGHATPGRRRFR